MYIEIKLFFAGAESLNVVPYAYDFFILLFAVFILGTAFYAFCKAKKARTGRVEEELREKETKYRLANRLHIDVLCEGVETEGQANYLKENGCHMAQGFFYNKPLKTEDIEKSNSPR